MTIKKNLLDTTASKIEAGRQLLVASFGSSSFLKSETIFQAFY